MPLTDEQQNAIAQLRAYLCSLPMTSSTAESIDQRARSPDPAHLPTDVTARVEIAPPSTQPHPLLDSSTLKAPECVPVYFYALHGEHAKSEVADTHVIFYMHGGGNVWLHPTFPPYIDFCARLLRAVALRTGDASKCVVIAPDYRLATVPENAFPAAVQDIVAAYDYVLSKGYKSSNIVIAGDSAGGNQAVVLTHLILQSDRPSPRGVVAIAPFANQVLDQLSEYAKAQADTDALTIPMLEGFTSAYVGDSKVSLADPLVSGVFIPFTASWLKTLILVGSGDLLIDASRELERRLSTLNIPVELVEYSESPHAWWLLPQVFSEDVQDAAKRVAQFVLE